MARKSSKREWFDITMADSGEAEILIYDAIGASFWGDDSVTAKSFTTQFNALLKKDPSVINVRLNSPGGEVSHGTAIYNTIRKEKDRVVVHIDGLAASIASIVALAGHRTVMADNALFMIHNPSTYAMGNAAELRKKADLLDKVRDTMVTVYTDKTGLETESVETAMAEETWYTAEEALEVGFVDEVYEGAELTAAFDVNQWRGVYAHMPPIDMGGLAPPEKKEGAMPESQKPAPPDDKAPAVGVYQLKKALPDASAEFLLAQLEEGHTIEEATAEYAKATAEELAKVKAAAEADKQAAVDAAVEATRAELAKAPGVDALGDSGDGGGNKGDGTYAEQWTRAIQAKVAEGKTRQQAVSIVARENPELREAFVQEHNEAHKAQGRG